MLAPKRQKYRKQFRGIWRRIAVKGHTVSFGSHALSSLSAGWITDRQIEACRVALARATRKTGKFWMRVFPDKPFTKKPPEVTMGAGKGDVSHFVAVVTPGRVLFEVDGLNREQVNAVFKTVTAKLPIKTRIVEKI